MKLNYPAVIVAAIVDFALGAGWFTFFAKPWIADLRLSTEEIAYYQSHMTPQPYLIAFVCSLVMAYGLACVVTRTGDPREHTVGRGVRYGLGFGAVIAAAILTELMFEKHGARFIAIAAGYPFLGMIIMGTIIGAWRGKRSVQQAKATRA